MSAEAAVLPFLLEIRCCSLYICIDINETRREVKAVGISVFSPHKADVKYITL